MPTVILMHPTEGQFEYSYKENSKQPALKQAGKFLGSAYGAYRFMQLIGTAGRVIAELARLSGSSYTSFIKSNVDIASKLAGSFIIPYWGYITCTLYEDMGDISKNGLTTSRLEKFFKDFSAWITAGCYAILRFRPELDPLRKLAVGADLTNSYIDLKQQTDGYQVAGKMQEIPNLTYEVRKSLCEKQTHCLIGIAKAVVAAVAAIFVLIKLAWGVALIPPIALLILGLAKVVFAIIKYFYAENMDRKITVFRPTEIRMALIV